MTLPQAFQGEPATSDRAVVFNGGQGVLGAAGDVTAMGSKDGTDAILIQADKTEQEPTHG
jgi:hypothetical protein